MSSLMQIGQTTVACSIKQNWLEQVAITLSYTVFTRLSAAALFKFLVFRMRRLFKDGAL